MIKHTMQEWADFTGCKVTINLQKTECKLFAIDSKVVKTSTNYLAHFSSVCIIPINLILDAEIHAWNIIVTPTVF